MLEVSHLTSHLGYWLRYVSNHVSRAFAAKLESRNVTVAEWVVLRELYGEDAMAPSHLAERLGLTRGAISKLADRLIAKDFVLREDSPDDGRAHTLALSPAGQALVPALSALADRNDAEFFGDLTAGERETVERILKAVVERRGLKGIPVS
ncbi:MarR family winged helix-turn-helix transcriptional regulator [Labrys monachus]|uniref:DNA-binding MarR family transcriptional regulator n=1 Tax=Labrys monachus TaxID=217067 RepID=A0ABU0FBD1_9HYPH|nr:MarR family transcriptional regulator [Labrys monachus]MDQ0391383.1 DNA-binding MarR family transcriptional regulator [Labrys monachus]